jgi:hypothetical protein
LRPLETISVAPREFCQVLTGALFGPVESVLIRSRPIAPSRIWCGFARSARLAAWDFLTGPDRLWKLRQKLLSRRRLTGEIAAGLPRPQMLTEPTRKKICF